HHLFPRFLQDQEQYARAELYWRRQWDQLVRYTRQEREWVTPWLQTCYADGTPMRDGDPIFSARSLSRRLAVRVVQNEPLGGGMELEYWTDTVGDQWTEEFRTLIISCALSHRAASFANDLILDWLRRGEVSVSR